MEIEDGVEERPLRRECQSGAGTARYDSASRNSVGWSCVGEELSELGSVVERN